MCTLSQVEAQLSKDPQTRVFQFAPPPSRAAPGHGPAKPPGRAPALGFPGHHAAPGRTQARFRCTLAQLNVIVTCYALWKLRPPDYGGGGIEDSTTNWASWHRALAGSESSCKGACTTLPNCAQSASAATSESGGLEATRGTTCSEGFRGGERASGLPVGPGVGQVADFKCCTSGCCLLYQMPDPEMSERYMALATALDEVVRGFKAQQSVRVRHVRDMLHCASALTMAPIFWPLAGNKSFVRASFNSLGRAT
jgi:hypothetical protein